MKAIARSHVWWPSLDKPIKELCQTCQVCQEVKHSPPTAPMYPMVMARQILAKSLCRFCWSVSSHVLFLLLDPHSKWPEIFCMSSASSTKTIETLKHVFLQFT